MKTLKIAAAGGLALAALMGLTLALTWWPPSTARAEEVPDGLTAPAAPLTLPPPYLSDDDVADAPYSFPRIWPPPAVDGLIAPGEYAHAGTVTFPGHGGDVEVYLRQDGSDLYVAFDLPLLDPSTGSNYADIYLDTDKDGDSQLDSQDHLLRVDAHGTAVEYTPNITGLWTVTPTVGWTAAAASNLTGGGWQAEFQVKYGKLGVTRGTFQEIGLGLGAINGGVYFWPAGGYSTGPHTWGSLVSSSDWDTFYWKPGPWEDYAPSGMPDFDQKQDAWWDIGLTGPVSTHCGPVAVANSLWWFDSKFESDPGDPAGGWQSDTYRLVTSYNPGMWDDHDPLNVVGGMGTPGLVNDLAWYFDTNGIRTGSPHLGTYITDMHLGTLQYLRDRGLWDDYGATLVISPSFDWVADEVLRSEDVVLLLGFYEDQDPDPIVERWARVGGHYVTVAGADPGAGLIAFSDPMVDGTEMGLGIIPPGRYLSGTMILPHVPGHPPVDHNDAGNVSHDVYPMVDTNSPGGTWGPEDYPWWMFEGWLLAGGVNPHPFTETLVWTGNPIQVEVEFALAVSPFDWKASGEWLVEGDDPIVGFWQPWQDYAPNGVPDFDQRQDNWIYMGPMGPQWSFCGPVAAANSLWWFDSKFEPSPLGPPQPPPLVPPIPINDNYPLVQQYGMWDDHDPLNVDDLSTLWPPGGEFVEDLALRADTDGMSSGSLHGGTVITDLCNGIEQYIASQGLRQGYVITMVESPDFWWVAEEVEVSEDVILLLGFWQLQGTDWVRLGGHYVTLPGVDKQGGFVAFSDPWFDRIEQSWPYAGQNTGPLGLPGWPEYTGRVANGWLISHIPVPGHPFTTHNDAGNVSHDIYNVVGTDSPGGVWGPELYVDFWGADVENFWGQNGQEDYPSPSGDPVQTEVDWALAVSPVADVWITKTVNTDSVEPGDWLTFTLRFRNDGSLPAEDVVITDILPSELVNPSWDYWTSNGLSVTARSGVTYAWDIPDLAWMEWGLITITAQVDPGRNWPAQTVIVNGAGISTTSVEQYQIDELPNTADAAVTVTPPPQPRWDKLVTINGVVTDTFPATVVASDTVEIVDRVWITYSAPVTFTLVEQWSASLELSHVSPGSGSVSPLSPSGPMTWYVTNDAPNAWHVLTKTFHVLTGTWNTDAVTESLWVEDADQQPADRVLTFIHQCVPINGVDFDWTPYPYPAAGEVATFTVVSVSPVTATPPFTYEWSFGDTGTATGDPVTHTYALSDVYTVYITATNPCGGPVWMSHPVTVTGEPDIAVSPMALSTALDPGESTTATLTVSNASTATADLSWSMVESPMVVWLSEDPVSGTLSPGSDRDIEVTFDAASGTPGTYLTTLQISSDDPDESPTSVPVTLTVNCVEVTSVTLSITNAGTIYTDTVVHFSADIVPDNAAKPYDYYVSVDGMSSFVFTDTADPFVFTDTFATTGTHSVEFSVWNCSMTLPVTDAITFTVREQGACVGLDSVTIAGDTSGYPGVYTFTTSYEPFDASMPITYTWDDDSTSDMSVRPLGVGTYTLVVTATNPCTVPPVTDTHEIVITAAPVCTEVTGITLTYTPTGTIYTDTVVHFSADIAPDDAAKPYTYTIDVGSGPTLPNLSTADPYLFTHTFPITGTHTITFSAWNCAMIVPQSDSVSVTVSAYGGENFIYLPLALRNYSP